jgi:Mrp family chromosome partitioning ATPase
MLPKGFANLMPKLKASDYEYIIFDMPPIARTGVTQRLASFMDMMLLVVEAEKTSREVVKQAGTMLTESKANVSVVLNKTRQYVPSRLHQEF